MSRSDQLIGLNDYARALLEVDPPTVTEYLEAVEGAWDTRVCDLNRHTLASGRIVIEALQETPWSGGPCYFLALQDEQGFWVGPTTWSEADIEAELGYSGEWTPEIARQNALAALRYAVEKMQAALESEDGIAITCAAARIAQESANARHELGPNEWKPISASVEAI